MTNILNDHPDHEIIALAVALAQEMGRITAGAKALPADLPVKEEGAALSVMVRPAEDIAKRLQGMVAATAEGEHFRALADIFLDE